MNTDNKKIQTLSDAVKSYVKNGDHISIGGFTISRNPMACVYEIIRQKIKNLHVYAHSNGQGVDELIGAGAVKRIEIAYSGNGRFASTCFCFKRKTEQGLIEVEDYSNYQMALRFLAGSMGIPFMPTYSSIGTDIIDKWGFDSELRSQNDKIAKEKVVLFDNPFSKRGNADKPDKLVLVPAINPDVTIIHAQKADIAGNTRIEGLSFSDVDQAKASKHVIVTCEEIIETNKLKKDPGSNQIPSFCVDSVVHVPMGAYPTACFNYYDYDPVFLEQYKKTAPDNSKFMKYLNDNIFRTENHSEFIKKIIGDERIDDLRADSKTGYSIGMKRK
jgi:glutaconate CoA-transferase, subunit A